jgi:hypothetical protein
MTQAIGMSQIQMQLLQNMLSTPIQRGSSHANTITSHNGPVIDDSKDYPRFDKFFESIHDKVLDYDLGLILAKLTDAGIYQVHELASFTDPELKEVELVIGDIKWLCHEVKKVIAIFSNAK